MPPYFLTYTTDRYLAEQNNCILSIKLARAQDSCSLYLETYLTNDSWAGTYRRRNMLFSRAIPSVFRDMYAGIDIP